MEKRQSPIATSGLRNGAMPGTLEAWMTKHSFDCCEIGADQLDLIGPLWDQLNAQHLALAPAFAHRRARRTFASRKKQLLAKAGSGGLRVDTALAAGSDAPIAYCVASLAPDGTGEIDSLFVTEAWRGRGVGTALMGRTLDWMDRNGVGSKVLSVACGNEAAAKFYEKFGFAPYSLQLRQVEPAAAVRGRLSRLDP
jgi:GNAT superfamily N-acetyltransferase